MTTFLFFIVKREREREVKGAQSKPNPSPMLSPNYGTRVLKKGRRMRTVPSLRGKSSGIITENYEWELSAKIMT